VQHWIVDYAAQIPAGAQAHVADMVISPLTLHEGKTRLRLVFSPGDGLDALLPLAVLSVADGRRPVRAVTANIINASVGSVGFCGNCGDSRSSVLTVRRACAFSFLFFIYSSLSPSQIHPKSAIGDFILQLQRTFSQVSKVFAAAVLFLCVISV
jgi:hypothetical protein